MTTWHPPSITDSRDVEITERQADVLSGICHGHSSLEIGARLYLSEETVKNHTRRLYSALGARNRAHAVALAISGQVHITVRETLPLRSAR